MAKKNHCPKCKGTGKINGSLTINGETTPLNMDCYICEGIPMSKADGIALQKEMDKESAMWCDCGNEDHDTAYYVADTPKMKHHWCCGNCDKIVQIG